MSDTRQDPFRAPQYEIGCGHGRSVSLAPIEPSAAVHVAERMTEIDPWRTLQIDREQLAASLHQEERGARRWAVILDGAPVGVIGVRYPWLFGPYLMLLAIFPSHQSTGVGSHLLRWLDAEAEAAGGNVWACVSSFNVRALSFYERHGFESIGELPDLVRSGYSEILIRKQLSRREAPDKPT